MKKLKAGSFTTEVHSFAEPFVYSYLALEYIDDVTALPPFSMSTARPLGILEMIKRFFGLEMDGVGEESGTHCVLSFIATFSK